VIVPPDALPPFTVVELNGKPWFKTGQSMNWNWYDRAPMGCGAGSLWHAGAPVVVPFDWSRYWWGCDGVVDRDGRLCGRVWTAVEMAALVVGMPTSAPTCLRCGEPFQWPHVREIGARQ
jgi:hypothetical protein